MLWNSVGSFFFVSFFVFCRRSVGWPDGCRNSQRLLELLLGGRELPELSRRLCVRWVGLFVGPAQADGQLRWLLLGETRDTCSPSCKKLSPSHRHLSGLSASQSESQINTPHVQRSTVCKECNTAQKKTYRNNHSSALLFFLVSNIRLQRVQLWECRKRRINWSYWVVKGEEGRRTRNEMTIFCDRKYLKYRFHKEMEETQQSQGWSLIGMLYTFVLTTVWRKQISFAGGKKNDICRVLKRSRMKKSRFGVNWKNGWETYDLIWLSISNAVGPPQQPDQGQYWFSISTFVWAEKPGWGRRLSAGQLS